MKKYNIILMLLFIALSLSINYKVFALVEPTSEFYVNDYANILSEETENYILNNSVKLASATKAQIVVVTVKNLEGQDIETYATNLFRKFGIGDEKKNNGLLILLALEERDIKIEVGYGLEEIVTDGLSGRYLDDYFVPYLKEDKWDEGIKNGYSAFLLLLCEKYNVNIDNIDVVQAYSDDDASDSSMLIAFFTGLVYGFVSKKNKKGKEKNPTLVAIVTIPTNLIIIYLIIKNFSGLNIFPTIAFCIMTEIVMAIIGSAIKELIVYWNTPRKRILSNGGYYGGSRSTGSSSGYSGGHSSGSSFHGGGGSSGGGGASRHF